MAQSNEYKKLKNISQVFTIIFITLLGLGLSLYGLIVLMDNFLTGVIIYLVGSIIFCISYKIRLMNIKKIDKTKLKAHEGNMWFGLLPYFKTKGIKNKLFILFLCALALSCVLFFEYLEKNYA